VHTRLRLPAMMSLVLCLGLASAFVPPTSMQQLSVSAPRVSAVEMMARRPPRASPTKPVVTKTAKPLSPGSNYPTTKNIQIQSNGFGTFVQRFQKATGKSKYGMPIFLPNGNVNPAYLAAERAEQAKTKAKNIRAVEAKRKKLVSKKEFELADYVRKKIGAVGSGKSYYQSGR